MHSIASQALRNVQHFGIAHATVTGDLIACNSNSQVNELCMRSCNQFESNQLWKLDCYYCMQLRDTVLHRCVRVLNASLPAAMLADDSAAEFTSRTLMIFHHPSRPHYLSAFIGCQLPAS